MGAVESMMAIKLEAHLKYDLDLVWPHLQLACRLGELVLQCDQECNDCVNNVKGSGDVFHGWKTWYQWESNTCLLFKSPVEHIKIQLLWVYCMSMID